MSVVVVGGGWSGLAAATILSQHGHAVTLFESDSQLGGRARAIDDADWPVDNGQHFMLGSYHDSLALLDTLELPPNRFIKRNLLRLEMCSAQHESVALHTPNVAAPMHLLWGMMRMRGVDLHERGTVFRLCARLIRNRFKIEHDIPLEQWLIQNGQTKRLIRFFWQPLSLALLNTPVKAASTAVMLQLLRKSFINDRGHSDLLFIDAELNRRLPIHAQAFLEQRNGQIRSGQKVTELVIKDQRITGVKVEGQLYPADQVVLATPAWVSANLLADHAELKETAQHLSQFEYQPTCTVYLRYPPNTRLGKEMLGLVDMTGHWVFDRSLNGQDGIMSVVIYGPGAHLKLSDATLIDTIAREMAGLFPNWPRPTDARVVRVNRATLSCPPALNALRPDSETAVKGLWLAGDYIKSAYPPRLESAVKSGVRCAKAIIKDLT